MTPEQFNSIYRAELGSITRFIARRVPDSEVEDLAGDLFEVAWQKRSSIPEGFEIPWLYKTARYLISNSRRKLDNRKRIFDSLRPPTSAPSAESIALADMELGASWGKLKPQEQEIIALWALEGLSNKEISMVIETSENAAAIRLTRAKASLKNFLDLENQSDVRTSN
jgi:RNA polymerase sigma-70 factor (ECF subfamily)